MSFQSLAFFGFLAAALAVCLTAGRRSPRAGAAMLAAVRTAQKIERGNIVVVFPDRAEKYLSTTMFDEFSD